MEVLLQVVVLLGKVVLIIVCVNFDVDVKIYVKIVIGKKENKFGILIFCVCEVYVCVVELLGLKVVGIDVYIGSQLIDFDLFWLVYCKVVELIEILCVDGYEIICFDLGGGFGIFYICLNEVLLLLIELGQVICEEVGYLGCEVEIELGWLIVGNVGLFVSEVIYFKEGEDWKFLIVDVVMNDLLCLLMYDVYYDIDLVIEVDVGVEKEFFDIVGLICEFGDIFVKVCDFLLVLVGDLIVFWFVGVYGVVMVSEYNLCFLIFEVLVDGDKFVVICQCFIYEEMIECDIVLEWF